MTQGELLKEIRELQQAQQHYQDLLQWHVDHASEVLLIENRELWELSPRVLSNKLFKKGGGVYRKTSRTKSRLIAKFKERGKSMSPELGTELREGADDVKVNVPYEITNVEVLNTEVSHYNGVRVELLTVKGQTGTVMLWKRPVTSKASKLGVFMDKLGTNTDRWLHKWVIFRDWEKGNRILEVTTAPESKATKATTAKGIAKAIKPKKGE